MNYAATLAVLVILSFFFPLVVRIANEYGVPETVITIAVLAALTFLVSSGIIRWRVGRHRTDLERLDTARAQVLMDPEDPRAYYVDGEHLAQMLLKLDRRREAAQIVDRYACLGGARESEIVALREALTRTEWYRRRNS
ncbi:hypothetical protein [Deinococcus maricopensis]|uniref:hypothetical protein n=1 Tax=Deinococcus maricopensis TaxID=309887 RepID=UPI0002DA21B3|nr:hypothetical protein [Deinococcus maricopensis]